MRDERHMLLNASTASYTAQCGMGGGTQGSGSRTHAPAASNAAAVTLARSSCSTCRLKDLIGGPGAPGDNEKGKRVGFAAN